MNTIRTLPGVQGSDWRDESACVGTPQEWWFGKDGAGHEPGEYVFYALATCSGCPVRQECLEDARRRKDFGQVRGGQWFPWDGKASPIDFRLLDATPSHGSDARYGLGCKCSLCKHAHNEATARSKENRKAATG